MSRTEAAVRGVRGTVLLLGLGAALIVVAGVHTDRGPSIPDEYVYLAGAKHFGRTGSLDARFYDTRAILAQGYPHQDEHAPGYVIALGAVMALFRGGYRTAVGLNVACYLGSALLVRDLARRLGIPDLAAWLSGAAMLLLPSYLLFNYWVMAEVLLGAAFLGVLVVGVRYGESAAGAAATGLLFGAAFLIRESVLFGLPAVLVLVARRRATRTLLAFAVAALAILLAVYAPLSRHRAAGGSNFWAPTSGRAFGFEAVQAGAQGSFGRAARIALVRAVRNLDELRSPRVSLAERGILSLYVLLPACALWSAWRRSALERRFVLALCLGWLAMVGVLFGFYVVVQWSGYRYLMFLMPAFLPWIALPGAAPPRAGAAFAACVLVACGGIAKLTLDVFNPFKAQRLDISYLEEHLPERAGRIVLRRGFPYGWKHYPVEVITTPPRDERELAELERALWFDYLVLSPESTAVAGRPEYVLVNPDDRDAPLKIYRRLR